MSVNIPEQNCEFEITSIELDLFMENLYVGTSMGYLYHIDLIDKANPQILGIVKVSEGPCFGITFSFGR